MLQLATPWALLLLLPLGAAGWRLYGRRAGGIRFAPTHRFTGGHQTWRMTIAALIPALAMTALAMLILALARPRSVLSSSQRHAEAVSIAMVIDISGSMEALDFSTRTATGINYRSRLDVVKEAFTEFVDRRPDDLISLIVFGGYASTLVPATADHTLLKHVLEGVTTPAPVFANGMIQNQEEMLTAIGDALATACARLREVETASKLIVLLSDGESNTGIIEPEEAVEIAKRLGIRVYVIGVGKTGRYPFRNRDRFGREVISYHHVSVDEDLLQHIADETGGRYINVEDSDALNAAIKAIDQLEKTQVEQTVYHQYTEHFPPILLAGLALLATAVTGSVWLRRQVL